MNIDNDEMKHYDKIVELFDSINVPADVRKSILAEHHALLAAQRQALRDEVLAAIPSPMVIREPEARGYNLAIKHARTAISTIFEGKEIENG